MSTPLPSSSEHRTVSLPAAPRPGSADSRSTPGRRWIGAAALAALALAGCGTSSMNTAAVVNGEVIAESDLQAALAQFPSDAQASPDLVLGLLVQGPVLEELARGTVFEVSHDEMANRIRDQLQIEDPEPLLVDTYRYNSYLTGLNQMGAVPTAEQLATLQVDLNPRYGQWDPTVAQVLPQTPEWIEPAGSAELPESDR